MGRVGRFWKGGCDAGKERGGSWWVGKSMSVNKWEKWWREEKMSNFLRAYTLRKEYYQVILLHLYSSRKTCMQVDYTA